jgi:predicted metal-dependent phosphoesterase TrpH
LEALTSQLMLAPDIAIDLQMHTIYSDGTWTPEQLIKYLVNERFGLVAITDHDRVDTVASLQQKAVEKQLPILAAVEMSTSWKGELTDVLCYGFDPEQIAMYREYAKTHHLLTSSGSDSHGPKKKPIKYRAELSRSLLERLGIQIS